MKKQSWEAHLETMAKSKYYTKTDNAACQIALAEIRKLRETVADFEPDAARMDALESFPFALELTAHLDIPKSDLVPSMRSQIDMWMDLGKHKV